MGMGKGMERLKQGVRRARTTGVGISWTSSLGMGGGGKKQRSIEVSEHRRGAVGRQRDHLWSWGRRKGGSRDDPVEVENRTEDGRQMW